MDERWQSVRNLLAVRLDNLGDVLMTTPALAAIRENLPRTRLTLLTSPAGAKLAPHVPAVDDAIVFEAPWVKCGGAVADGSMFDGTLGLAERRLVDLLASRRFDAVVIFTVCTQSALPAALLCRLAGIRLRLAHARENPYGLLTDWARDTEVVADGMRHEVERQLALVASVGMHPHSDRLRLQFDVEDVQRARQRLLEAGVDPARPYFIVHPGASAPSRRWPPERFGAAADAVASSSGCQAVFAGGRGEDAIVDAARAAMQAPSALLSADLSIGELAAVIAGAQLLVANNSAPAHVAAAVGTPLVELYALTNPQHTPWRARSRVLNHDVPCRNCLKSECPVLHHGCLRGVATEAVVQASLDLIGPGPALPLMRGLVASQRPAMQQPLAEATP